MKVEKQIVRVELSVEDSFVNLEDAAETILQQVMLKNKQITMIMLQPLWNNGG